MFRNRQPAWPYRCTGKDARTGVFFFALRAGAARAFPAAGHAHGREAAASPAANTAARPKSGARRKSCAPNPRVHPTGRRGRRHRRQRTRRHGESRRAAQTVRAQPARAPRGTARAAASPAGNTAARRRPARGADRARPTRACAPRDGTGGGIAGREHGGAAKAGARRRSCAPNPRVRPAGWHGRRHRRQGTRRRGEGRRAAQIVRANPSGRRKTTEPYNYYHFKPYFKTLSRKSALPRSCDASNHRRLLQ